MPAPWQACNWVQANRIAVLGKAHRHAGPGGSQGTLHQDPCQAGMGAVQARGSAAYMLRIYA